MHVGMASGSQAEDVPAAAHCPEVAALDNILAAVLAHKEGGWQRRIGAGVWLCPAASALQPLPSLPLCAQPSAILQQTQLSLSRPAAGTGCSG